MHDTSFRRPPAMIGRLSVTITAAAALVTALANACSSNSNTEPSTRIVYGSAQSIGQGTARVYAILGSDDRPLSVGVALTEGVMTGLPQTPQPGSPSAVDLMLPVPDEARVTGLDHLMLDWNPMGHDPAGVYTIPHFDLHFFTIPVTAQMAIMPSDPNFAAKADSLPPVAFRPVGMFKIPGAVPMMGAHWADPTSPEQLPPPNTQPFTRTFLYGSYAGHFIFFEPMITKAHIESLKTLPGNVIATPIKLPPSYEHPGYYPTQYTMSWDASAKEYRIALDGLVEHR